MIRILLADDHNVVRHGVRQVLALAEEFIVIAEARDGWELIGTIRSTPADLLITDLSMPGPHGIELVKRIRETCPHLPILIFTMHADHQLAARALRAGANGYLTKDCEPAELISAVRRTARGQRYIDPTIAAKIMLDTPDDLPPHSRLSNRELQILTLLAGGTTVTEIARGLNLSAKTVSTHKSRLMLKLDLGSSADLVRYALTHGLVQ